MYYSASKKLAIYAEGELGKNTKTAEGVLRYGYNEVVAVIDSSNVGRTVQDVTGIPSSAPIVASLQEALQRGPDALLLGAAYDGGAMPKQWRTDILVAINAGLDVINGLHDFLQDDAEFVAAAKQNNCQLIDVRKPPDDLPIACGRALSVPSYIVLTVGSDSTVGKMTVSLELLKAAKKRGIDAGCVATGQTGIMICGNGIAIDRVIGDFMAGATEQLVVQAGKRHEMVLVEGQGSLVHPAYSGVTLALLHGSCPHAMILVTNPLHKTLQDTPFPVPTYKRLIHIYEDFSTEMRPAKVIGIALNTRGMSESEAQAALSRAREETGLPATDAVRFGADNLLEALIAYGQMQGKLAGLMSVPNGPVLSR